MTGNELPAVARSANFQDVFGSLHAQAHRTLVVLEDFLQVRWFFAAALIDSVEALRVTAGKLVLLQAIVSPKLELMLHLADGHTFDDNLLGFEFLMRQLEVVIP